MASEGTRIDRRPTVFLPNRVAPVATPDPEEYGFEERLALFTVAMAKERALELLENLHRSSRPRAREHARRVASWDSPLRQARLAWVFGARPDAGERLRALWKDCGPLLKREVWKLLPPYHRSSLPLFNLAEAPADPACPALRTLAERFVREATR